MGQVTFKTQDELAAEKLKNWRKSTKVSAFQALAALDQAGHLDQIETMMADSATPKKTKLAFEKAQEFRRESPTVLAIAEQLGLTDEDLDNLFEAAAQIEA